MLRAGAEDGEKNRRQREQKQPTHLALALHATALEVVGEDEVVRCARARFRLDWRSGSGHKYGD